MQQTNITNKVILITGGTRGIGRATVIAAAHQGSKVVFCGRESLKLEKIQQEINDLGLREHCLGVAADISKEEDVKNLFDKAYQRFSRIDIVINNAAITRDFLLTFMPTEAWHDVLAVNLNGVFLVSRYAAQFFLEHQIKGKILSVGSVMQNGSPSAIAYSTSKGALIGLTKSMAKEFAVHGITVNLISFGYVNTELMSQYPEEILITLKDLCPLKRIASEKEAADVLLSVASFSDSIVNGQCIQITGGLSDIPALSFSRLSESC